MTTLVIIAKECLPGRVKTRLHPAVSYEQAAELAAASLADTIAVGGVLPAERRILAFDGLVPPPDSQAFEIIPQSSGDLDERLATIFDTVTGPTLLVGMDTPQLRVDDLAGLFPWPGDTDFVFGPADDGGFWCLGMREPRGDLIRGVAMSQGDTGARQLERLQSTGGTIRMLGSLTDIDTIVEARTVAALAPETQFARTFERTMLLRQLVGGTLMSELATFGSGGAEPYARALLRDEETLFLHALDGSRARIDVTRWTEDADATDRALLRRARGPVLDIGCGPGRMVKAAAARGMKVLGIDVSPVAVEIVRTAGLPAYLGSIFDPIPHEGSWSTALLLDGNIGIGGDPAALLARCREVLRSNGDVIVETHEDPWRNSAYQAAVAGIDGELSDPFAWAEVGRAALGHHASAAGLRIAQSWGGAGRFFSRLVTTA